MIGSPFRFYRTDKTPDNAGGFTEAGTLIGTFFGTLRVHQNSTTINLDEGEDVLIGDLVEGTNAGWYRVTAQWQALEMARQQIAIEKIDRPIWAGKVLS